MPQNDGQADPYPLNSAGKPQHYAFGHKIKGQPKPTPIAALLDEKNRLRRALRSLTAGCEQLQYAAEVCADMKMNRPDFAVLHVRSKIFSDRFDGLPFCEVEKDLIATGRNAMIVLTCYSSVKRVIERQLEAMQTAASGAATPPSVSN